MVDLKFKFYLKVEYPTNSTSCHKYFGDRIIVTKAQIKSNFVKCLFMFPTFPYQDRGGGGGAIFSMAKFFKFCFHTVDTWICGQRMGKLTKEQS